MKKNNLTTLYIFLFFLACIASYIMRQNEANEVIIVLTETSLSLIEVPICNFRVANQLGIQSSKVQTYITELPVPGMTRNEVEEKLNQIAPVSIIDTYVSDDEDFYVVTLRVKLCRNPLGNLVLNLYYSKDEKLIRVEDDWAD